MRPMFNFSLFSGEHVGQCATCNPRGREQRLQDSRGSLENTARLCDGFSSHIAIFSMRAISAIDSHLISPSFSCEPSTNSLITPALEGPLEHRSRHGAIDLQPPCRAPSKAPSRRPRNVPRSTLLCRTFRFEGGGGLGRAGWGGHPKLVRNLSGPAARAAPEPPRALKPPRAAPRRRRAAPIPFPA